jgi:RNA polymerase sigma-70 factor (ECF subfamily)
MPPSHSANEPWRACYEQLAPKLLLFARQWLPAAQDAEDAVQAGFVRFWKKQPHAQPEHYPLLYAAVRSAALDLIRTTERRNRRDTSYHEQVTADTGALFEPSLTQREDALMVEHALQRLPTEQREVLVLRIWGELTFAQIAEALSQNINTVAARYRYGLEALRKSLTPHVHESV